MPFPLVEFAPLRGLRTLLVERMKRGMPGIAPLVYQDLAWKSLYPRLSLVKLFLFWGPRKDVFFRDVHLI